jgi:hypothetical protein
MYNTLMQDAPIKGQNWVFRDGDEEPISTGSNDTEVTWTASEYIAHQKGPAWYVLLALASVSLSAVVYFISRDRLTVVAILVVASCFGFLASRSPRTLHYMIDSRGITIADKLYPHAILRSFSVQEDGGLHSVQLIPLKRFMPAISLYYPPDQEEHVLSVLSNYIPHEERRPDAIDKLMRRVRF